jgi:hypothetical protein
MTTDLLENSLAFAATEHEGDPRVVLNQAKAACRTLAKEVERLNRRLAVKCEHPNAAQCAKLWQADTNQRQLKDVSPELADEFPWGCDTVEHLATALVASRLRVKLLLAELASIPSTRDGVRVVPVRGVSVWRTSGPEVRPQESSRFVDGLAIFRDDPRDVGMMIGDCYSTKEAAEAAGKENP